MKSTVTRTYALLEVSPATFDEIRAKLRDAGYDHAFHDDDDRVVIDMHGVALVEEQVVASAGDDHTRQPGIHAPPE